MSNDSLRMRLLLTKYQRESQKTKERLIEKFQVPIESLDIQLKLADHFDLKNSEYIAFQDLNAEQMFEILKDKDFSNPIHSEVVSIEKSVLPSGLPRLLTEERIKSKGEQRIIYKYDKDVFPSDPHAHNYGANVKLHLGTGELFNKKRVLVGKLKRKQLEEIRSKVRNIILPTLSVN